jgi:hypothetical protein
MTALRPLHVPVPVIVETDGTDDGGSPRAVVSRGRRLAVAAIVDRWRIDDEWWREPICRHYYLLELSTGSLLTVFRDCFTGDWFAQRYGYRGALSGNSSTSATKRRGR